MDIFRKTKWIAAIHFKSFFTNVSNKASKVSNLPIFLFICESLAAKKGESRHYAYKWEGLQNCEKLFRRNIYRIAIIISTIYTKLNIFWKLLKLATEWSINKRQHFIFTGLIKYLPEGSSDQNCGFNLLR